MSDNIDKGPAGQAGDSVDAAAQLKAAKLKIAKLKAIQEKAAREAEAALENAERLEAAQTRAALSDAARKNEEKQKAARQAEIERLQAGQKRTARKPQPKPVESAPVATMAATGSATIVEDDLEQGDESDGEEFLREPDDEIHAETGKRRRRIGLYCFNCNRPEGHFLKYYRNMLYSYIVGITFGMAIMFGPYRCQCCGSSRLMMSNLFHPKYYLALMTTRGKSSHKRRSRK